MFDVLMPSAWGGKARLTLRAHRFDLDGLSVKAVAQISREAKNQGPAMLAATSVSVEDRDAEARALVFSDASSGGCREIEKCLHRLRDMREKVDRILTADDGLPPPREPMPVTCYHVCVFSQTSAPHNVSASGAVVRFRFRAAGNTAQRTWEASYTQELPLNRSNLVCSVAAEHEEKSSAGRRGVVQNARGDDHRHIGARLFQQGGTDVFHVEFDRDLGDICGVELQTASGSGSGRGAQWYVDKVVVARASDASVAWAANSGPTTRVGSGRSWTFMGDTVNSMGGDIDRTKLWGALPVGSRWQLFGPQATVHVVVRVCDAGSLVESCIGASGGVLELSLTLVGNQGRSAPIFLSNEEPLGMEKGKGEWHFVLHGDGHGEGHGTPLLELVQGGVRSVEATREASAGAAPKGSPFFLETILLWCQHSDEIYHFPCNEWLDGAEAVPFVPEEQRMTKKLAASNLHAGPPPPQPSPPSLEARQDPVDPSQQLLVISCGDGARHNDGMHWHVQCVEDDGSARNPVFLSLLDRQSCPWCGRGGLFLSTPVLEVPLRTHVRIGNRKGLHAGTYLVRASAIHPSFGEGPFSAVVRYVVAPLPEDTSRPGWVSVLKADELGGLQIKRPKPSELVAAAAKVQHAVHLGELNARSTGGRQTLISSSAGRSLAVRPVRSFEEGVQPASEQLPQELICVGEAEVWRGALELTPLRKGIGTTGAAWHHAPLSVVNGFETEFSFCISPPADRRPGQRSSDGFAFVLQLDGNGTSSLGTSGIQLGLGGLENSLAVQFATNPSCSNKRKVQSRSENDEGVLCTLPEPHDHIFMVPYELSNKECTCPFTGVRFIAPDLGEYAPTHDTLDLSHHIDRVSVQSAGARGNSSGPEASLASSAITMLDDGELHHARIVFADNCFLDPRLPRNIADDDPDGPTVKCQHPVPSRRLLVYVDNMQNALINLELNLRDVFGDMDGDWDGSMIAGFTASTGKQSAAHTITSWSFYEIKDESKGQRNGWLSSIGL